MKVSEFLTQEYGKIEDYNKRIIKLEREKSGLEKKVKKLERKFVVKVGKHITISLYNDPFIRITYTNPNLWMGLFDRQVSLPIEKWRDVVKAVDKLLNKEV